MKRKKSIFGAVLLSTVLAGNVFAGNSTGGGSFRLLRQRLQCRRFVRSAVRRVKGGSVKTANRRKESCRPW